MIRIRSRFGVVGGAVALLMAGALAPHAALAESAGGRSLVSPSAAYAPGGETATVSKSGALPKADDSIGLNSMPPSAVDLTSLTNADAETLQKQAEIEAARAAQMQAQREQEHNTKSFDKASNGLMPLSADQIREFMHRLEATQDASQAPYAGTPKAEVKISTLSLDPGVDPPVVNLSAGYVTTINMVDATGEPWPILDVGVGGNFEVTPTQSGSHVVRIVPLTRVGTGNLSVLLKDLSTPVIFRLSSGNGTVHMRYDARIPKMGPNAKAQLIDRGRRGPTAGDEVIMMLLQNNPPANAKRMKVSGLDARSMAWQIDSKFYVRTPVQMLSPAWNASASSADGMTVYEIGDAPVLLMSDGGALIRARLLRDEDHDK